LRKNGFAKCARIPSPFSGLLYQKNNLVHRHSPFTPKWMLTQQRLRHCRGFVLVVDSRACRITLR
jgi:hypothetical protein